jgi:hypothetical protein
MRFCSELFTKTVFSLSNVTQQLLPSGEKMTKERRSAMREFFALSFFSVLTFCQMRIVLQTSWFATSHLHEI